MPVLDADTICAAGIRVFLNFVHKPRLGRGGGHSETAGRFACPCVFRPAMKSEYVRNRAADLLVG
jgi:hypothetical protein